MSGGGSAAVPLYYAIMWTFFIYRVSMKVSAVSACYSDCPKTDDFGLYLDLIPLKILTRHIHHRTPIWLSWTGQHFSYFCKAMASVMMHCICCSSEIVGDAQHYLTSDLGPEINSIVERNLGNEVPEDGMLCSQCFANILQELRSSQMVQLRPETNVCVLCRSSLYERRTHSIGEGPVWNHVAERISPRQIPEGGLLCFTCWVETRRLLRQRGIISAPAANTNVCVCCRVSLSQRRRHSLPEGPERDDITQRIYPREIPDGGRVCYACWVRARRNVQRRRDQEPNRPENIDLLLEPGPSNSHYGVSCAWCRINLFRRRTHVLSGAEREQVALRIQPIELPEQALVCDGCWERAREMIQINEGHLVDPEARDHNSMTLDEFTHTPNNSRYCFVPGCTNSERLRVPDFLRKRILMSQKIFVTEYARICQTHKSLFNWEFLDNDQFSNTFSKREMEAMLKLLVQNVEMNMNFARFELIDDDLFKYWTGITKDKYVYMLNTIMPALSPRDKPKTALGVFLIKTRTGDSHERIASLLHLSKPSVTRLLKKVRDALDNLFRPLHLGIHHITREELINRNLLIPEGLFGDRENRKPIVICDGTYIYLQKSSNYYFQKKTYSLHKYRNLIKPFLLVATDGHIIDAFGPYPATTSDADIMKALFQDENGDLRSFFEENDIFILDRGFRDALPFLESLGYNIYKPESLEEGERQLPTDKANKSRLVTLCRWVVEVVNGRFKRDFRIFRNEYFNKAADHLMVDFRICAAMINAFHPEITDRLDAQMILNRALERLNMPNVLGDLIISNRINRLRAQFHRIDGQLPALDIFPQMSMSDLILFALGTYQIKQARSYYGEHIRQHGTFAVEVSDELEVVTQALSSSHETLLLRGRIKSRHQSGRIYYTYILLTRQGTTWSEKLTGYYCSCICGLRTVGCCAHVMTIVWYLGWARYQESIEAPAPFLDGILIREDIENEE